MSFDGQTTLKEVLEDLSLDGIMRVIDIIRQRDDIASIIVTTKDELKQTEERYKIQHNKLMGVPDEPA
jgi:hypothetical protein